MDCGLGIELWIAIQKNNEQGITNDEFGSESIKIHHSLIIIRYCTNLFIINTIK